VRVVSRGCEAVFDCFREAESIIERHTICVVIKVWDRRWSLA
jgi:hypothetical protein